GEYLRPYGGALEGISPSLYGDSIKIARHFIDRSAQQERDRDRHQERCHQRIEAHGDAGEYARDRVDLERARGTDAMRGNAGGKSARAKIRDADPVHQWRDYDCA